MSLTTLRSDRSAVPTDINAETYPYDVVQHLLDQTVTLSLYATPVRGHFGDAVITPDRPDDFFGINGGYGLNLACDLHALESVATARSDRRFLVGQAAGPCIGHFKCVLLFERPTGSALRWAQASPPPAIYDRWRSQACVLTDPSFTFTGDDGFRSFGVGRTYPVHVSGAPLLLLGAAGNLVEGRGVFRDREVSFSLCGSLTTQLGFEGVITCRVVDPNGELQQDAEPSEPEPSLVTLGDGTFIVMRGVKKDGRVRTTFGPKPAPNLDSLVTPAEMRSVRYGLATDGASPVVTMSAGPVIAHMTADVRFNLGAPPGTSAAPAPFTTQEQYEFVDGGDRDIGRVRAGVTDGISFGLQFPAAPGQLGVRFAGFGPITGGTGAFTGAQGLLTVNSVIGIAPHALSLTHVLLLVDPEGKWRVAR